MSAAAWTRAASVAEVEASDGLLGVSLFGQRIALYGVDGEYFATSDICTHGNAALSQGYLDGFLIECPLHQGLFDIRTGAVKGPPCSKPIASYPVRREGDDLLVDLSGGDSAGDRDAGSRAQPAEMPSAKSG